MESVETLEKTTFCGRRFTRAQLARIQETVQTFQSLSRNELASTICEHLDWTTPSGTLKVSSGLNLLEKLEAHGVIRLPPKQTRRPRVRTSIPFKQPEQAIEASLDALGPISLRCVATDKQRALWKSFVESHHYLGYKRPIGFHLFYFVVSEALQQKVGCLSFSTSAAWTLSARDEWIGWDKHHREKLLHLVLCQNRFLIFPWIKVANLGSRVLSLATQQVGDDWVRLHGYRPVLIETFVDTTRFSGATYRAANWQYLGDTQGRGRDPESNNERTRKAIFAYPLQSNWRQGLTQVHATRTLRQRYRNDVRASRSREVEDSFVSMWQRVLHILGDLAEEYDASWQIRKRVLNSLLLMLLIFRLVSSKNSQSYGTTIDELWDSCEKLNITLPQQHSVSPSAFCDARKKLDASIFKRANARIIEAYAPQAERFTWRGHRLFAVDGSKLNLPRKLVRYGYKTPSDNANYPQGLLSCLYQVQSQLPYDFSLVSHADERQCANKHLSVLHPNDVVVYDRGYFSYAMLHRHWETGIHAVFRLQESSYNVIREFFADSRTDEEVDIFPSARTQQDIRKRHPDVAIVPLRMRLIKYEVAGTTYCLGTTLLDAGKYPIDEFMDVYHARWGVEELYKVSKRVFVIEDFHAKSERGVKQELYAHFVLTTMSRLFANEADSQLNADNPRPSPEPTDDSPQPNTTAQRIQTNFKNCIQVVARSIEELLLIRDSVVGVVRRVFKLVIGRSQRERPGRSYPRTSMRPHTKWKPSKKDKKRDKNAANGLEAAHANT